MSRGQTVLVTFKKQYDTLPVEGCLFNEDPITGTLFVVVKGDELLTIYRDHVDCVQVLKSLDEDDKTENQRIMDKVDALLDVNSLVLGLDHA